MVRPYLTRKKDALMEFLSFTCKLANRIANRLFHRLIMANESFSLTFGTAYLKTGANTRIKIFKYNNSQYNSGFFLITLAGISDSKPERTIL